MTLSSALLKIGEESGYIDKKTKVWRKIKKQVAAQTGLIQVWDVLDVALRVLLIWYIGDHYFLNYGLNVEWNIK